jgi:hypothetical protein
MHLPRYGNKRNFPLFYQAFKNLFYFSIFLLSSDENKNMLSVLEGKKEAKKPIYLMK